MIWPFRKAEPKEDIPDFYLYPFGSFSYYGKELPITEPHPESRSKRVFRERALLMAEEIGNTNGMLSLQIHFQRCKTGDKELSVCGEMAVGISNTPQEAVEKTRKYLNV